MFRLAALLGFEDAQAPLVRPYLTSVILASAGWLWLIGWVVRQMI